MVVPKKEHEFREEIYLQLFLVCIPAMHATLEKLKTGA